jgi:ATP-dependent protease ClpP protease subunit
MTVVQVPGTPSVRDKTVYVSFSAEINVNTAESLLATLANLANQGAAEVRLLLSTPGGDVMHGISLYNMLRAFPFRLITHNVSSVNSIGNAVFLAGEKRYASPHATFMYHGVQAGFQPPIAQLGAEQLRERLGCIDADELRIGSIIEERSKLAKPQVRAFFGEAHTMDATEAVSAGIIDEIEDVKIPPGSPVVGLVFQR